MSGQATGPRRSARIVWRHKMLVGMLAVLGLLVGVSFAVLKPPMVASKALVALPHSTSSMATQVVIVTSNPVLSGALPEISPKMSLAELRSVVQARSVTSYILSISATGATAAQAANTANAVAHSYIDYVGSANIPVAHVTANMFEPATAAAGSGTVKHFLLYGLLGLLIGALIGIITALAISRTDRRLRERDEIANAIGVPVLASVPVDHPADAAGWTRLLEDYEAGPLQAWYLRNVLERAGVIDVMSNGRKQDTFTLAVVSLSSDPGAVALGPQLAVFAASLEIPTTLLVGPQQDVSPVATLRTVCAAPPPPASKRPEHLHIAVSDADDADSQPRAALTIVVTVVDSENPQLADAVSPTATVLGVSAGAATAEQVARAASSAAAGGHDVVGILVADPESTDTTTGRFPSVIQVGPVPARREVSRPGNRKQEVYNPGETPVFTKISDFPLGPSTEIRR